MTGAAVDVGSTSVHLLAAIVRGDGLEPLADESAFLGLGAAVDAHAVLGEEKTGELVVALAAYAERARGLGAAGLTVVGTEPVRRALDAATVVRRVERESGLALHVLSHEEEGLLTLLGATAGRAIGGEVVIVDVGGGSTEVVVVAPGRLPVTAGLPAGAGRLASRFVHHDPPQRAEIEAMLSAARSLVSGAPVARPQELIAVGGTADKLRLLANAESADRPMTRADFDRVIDLLELASSAVIAERYALRPQRARMLPAGAAILIALFDRYSIGELRVSAAGIREGTILAAARAGVGWRDRLSGLAGGRER